MPRGVGRQKAKGGHAGVWMVPLGSADPSPALPPVPLPLPTSPPPPHKFQGLTKN